MAKVNFTSFWTFFCNPAKWEIDKFLSTNIVYDTYQINKWHVKYFNPGQLGVIRVGVDKRTKSQLGVNKKLLPGIYAIVEVLSEPFYRKNKPDKFWLKWAENEKDKPVVEIRYIKNMLINPLLISFLKQDNSISYDDFILNGFQASSMPLDKITFEKILLLSNLDLEVLNNIEPVATDTEQDILKLDREYKDASPHVKEVISKRIERGLIAQKIKSIYNHKCLICENLFSKTNSFIKINGKPYIETHHIVPVSTLYTGSLGISNLITVCANHHRQLHYGNVLIKENTLECLTLVIDSKSISIKKAKFKN